MQCNAINNKIYSKIYIFFIKSILKIKHEATQCK